MCHLIKHVLPEANLTRIGPNLQQEQIHAAKKVPHGLGTDNFLEIQIKQKAEKYVFSTDAKVTKSKLLVDYYNLAMTS